MNRKLPCNKSDFVIVWWDDAISETVRMQPEEVANAQLAVNWNVGWIVHENEKRVMLIHGGSSSGEVDVFQIAKADILEIVPLIPKRRKKGAPDADGLRGGHDPPSAEDSPD
jgi:hypothetical protein